MWPASCGISATGLSMCLTISWLTAERSSLTSAARISSDGRRARCSSRLTMMATKPGPVFLDLADDNGEHRWRGGAGQPARGGGEEGGGGGVGGSGSDP